MMTAIVKIDMTLFMTKMTIFFYLSEAKMQNPKYVETTKKTATYPYTSSTLQEASRMFKKHGADLKGDIQAVIQEASGLINCLSFIKFVTISRKANTRLFSLTKGDDLSKSDEFIKETKIKIFVSKQDDIDLVLPLLHCDATDCVSMLLIIHKKDEAINFEKYDCFSRSSTFRSFHKSVGLLVQTYVLDHLRKCALEICAELTRPKSEGKLLNQNDVMSHSWIRR